MHQGLPTTLIFDYPTIESLMSFLSGEIASDFSDKEEKPHAPPAASDDILSLVESLADDEVERLLQKEGANK